MTNENNNTKICRICKQLKLFAEFHKSKRLKDGLSDACKECACIISKEWRIKNAERSKTQRKEYREKNRERLAAIERERRKKNPELMKKGLESLKKWNMENPEKAKELRKLSSDRYKINHPERRKETYKKYHKLYPERKKALDANKKARRLKREGILTSAEIKNLHILQEGKCNLCKIDISSYYEVDHVIPFKHGGLNTISNIQLTCKPCNSKKRTKLDYVHQ